VCVCVCVCVCVRVCACVCDYLYVCACVCVYFGMCLPDPHHKRCTELLTQAVPDLRSSLSFSVFVVCMYKCVYIHMCIYINT